MEGEICNWKRIVTTYYGPKTFNKTGINYGSKGWGKFCDDMKVCWSDTEHSEMRGHISY